jgi:hypothetical protein
MGKDAKGIPARRVRRRRAALAGVALALVVPLIAAGIAQGGSPVSFVIGDGEDGPATGQFDDQNGVAANDSAIADGALDALGNPAEGHLYVADEDNHRVQAFDSAGVFQFMFGRDVNADLPGTGAEVCTREESCQGGTALAGEEAGELDEVQGVAVDQSTGDVYVSEDDNARISKFDAAGNFILAIGRDVNQDGLPAPHVCLAGDDCRAGADNGAEASFSANFTGHIAVDPNPPHDLYVADEDNARIQVFGSSGAFLRTYGHGVEDGTNAPQVCLAGCQAGIPGPALGQLDEPTDVALDDAGRVYVVDDDNQNVVRFADGAGFGAPAEFAPAEFPAETTSGLIEIDVGAAPGTADDRLFALREPTNGDSFVKELDLAGNLLDTHGEGVGINHTDGSGGIGYDPGSDLIYLSSAGDARVFAFGAIALDAGLAIEEIAELGPSEATVVGSVDPDGLPTTYRIHYRRAGEAEATRTVEFDAGDGTDPVEFSIPLAGLVPGAEYEAQVIAERPFADGFGTRFTRSDTAAFTTLSVPPEVGTPTATSALEGAGGGAIAALYGRVNPNGGASTYRFEYGESDAYGQSAPAPDGDAGAGADDVPVAASIAGLAPATTYHFRLVAENATGESASPDRTFTTPAGPSGDCPNEAIRAQQGSTHLPECRAFELVSPADKGPSGSVAIGPITPQVFNQSAEEGGGIVYPIQNGTPGTTAGGWLRMRAERAEGGWLSEQISAPALIRPPSIGGVGLALPSSVYYASEDLGCAIVVSYNPLTGEEPQASLDAGMVNLYRWSTADGSYDLITDVVPENPEGRFDTFAYDQIETSQDCSRVYFMTLYRLIAGVNAPGPGGDDGYGLYEWEEGEALRHAGELPDGSIPALMGGGPVDSRFARASVGGQVESFLTSRRDAVTPAGDLFFTARSNEGEDAGTQAVFMRSGGGAEVTDISQSQTAAPTTGARFEAASADGGTVLFRANYGIAPGGGSAGPTGESCGSADGGTVSSFKPPLEPKPCELYAYEVASGELRAVSADPNPLDPIGAAAQGVVAVDEDGSHVYFAALGQLVPGKGRTYAQNVAGAGGEQSANVYLDREGELSYVATLSRQDLLGSPAGGSTTLARMRTNWNANASADGEKLLFEASSELSGQDGFGAGGGKYAYLYDAATGALACVSCPPGGGGTLTEPSLPDVSAGTRLVTGGTSSNLTHRPSALSADGERAFFSSPDALAPGAVPGETNVYEWEGGRVHFLATVRTSAGNGLGRYLDASADGEDVFVATRDQLAPQDNDFVADVYDIRVEGGFPFSEPPPQCQVDEAAPLQPNQTYCQGERGERLGDLSAPSTRTGASGNIPPSPCARRARRAQRLSKRAKALRRRARAARGSSRPRLARRKAKRARRAARGARRHSRAAKRCRQRGRPANRDRGGAR